jgi:hypothetical protein
VDRVDPQDLSHEWLVRVVTLASALLDHGAGAMNLQDLADYLDYGPNEASPRLRKKALALLEAFHRAVDEQAEKCAVGDHLFGPKGKCQCGATRLTLVDPE